MKNKIYILDDDPDTLSLLRDMVEDAYFQAKCFTKGEELFLNTQEIEENTLMVLDLNMPEMDGIEVMRRLIEFEFPPALILISGHDAGVLHSAEKLGRAHNLNIFASISKPISLRNFQELLKKFQNKLDSGKKNTTQNSYKNTSKEIDTDELLYALKNEQMVLFYQPKINISTGKCTACEALIRWEHPSLGLIFPDQFIPIVENNGWMQILTNWVIKQAVEQLQKWSDSACQLPISVNVSADNITSLALPEQLSELLIEKKMNPTLLTLEVTESALMGELVTCLDILTRLRLKGLGLSIDDFGTGYSSLSQLHKIPFSELKIDQSFVFDMLVDEEAKAIVKTCIMLGHELNMEVVAEGVETKEHLDILSELGCDIAQGYYFSKAVNAKSMTEYLLKNK